MFLRDNFLSATKGEIDRRASQAMLEGGTTRGCDAAGHRRAPLRVPIIRALIISALGRKSIMKNKAAGRGPSLDIAISRRHLLQGSAGIIGGSLLPAMPAFAADHAAIGTYPDGSSGSSVFIGIAVPRTGTYALQGEDELKGWQL